MNVALDTMILIWCLRDSKLASPATPNEAKRVRAQALFKDLNEQKARLVIPTVIVSELLYGVPARDRRQFLEFLSSNFFCPPFDLRASLLASEIWEQTRQAPPAESSNRNIIKADAMIVATAKVAGVNVFYSDDAGCRRMASACNLDARDLPSHSENLLTDAEARKGVDRI